MSETIEWPGPGREADAIVAEKRRVIIESPYAGDVERNVEYARRAVRDSLERGEAPIASHLLYTQPGILRDRVPSERQWGIDAGLAWRQVADATVVYADLGISEGMQYGIRAARKSGIPVETRYMDAEMVECRICGGPTNLVMTADGEAPCGPCVLGIVCP